MKLTDILSRRAFRSGTALAGRSVEVPVLGSDGKLPPSVLPAGGSAPASTVDYVSLTSDFGANPSIVAGGPPRVAIYGDVVLLMGVLEPTVDGATLVTNAPIAAKYRPNVRRQFLAAHGGFAGYGGVSRTVDNLNGVVVHQTGHIELVYSVDASASETVLLDGISWRSSFAAGW